MTTTDLFSRTRVQLAAGAQALGSAIRTAYTLADHYVLAELEAQPAIAIDGTRGWIDTRPLLDEREHSPQVIDIWTEVLAHATWRGLVDRHPAQPHMVRIVNRGA